MDPYIAVAFLVVPPTVAYLICASITSVLRPRYRHTNTTKQPAYGHPRTPEGK